MRLHEYQAKELFRQHNIAVPAAAIAENRQGLPAALDLVGYPCVLKAQVLQGGRGKSGLIRRLDHAAQALITADEIWARKAAPLLVEELIAYKQELYVSITLDAIRAQAILLFSSAGGMEIEQVAQTTPEQVRSLGFSLKTGLHAADVANMVAAADFEPTAKERQGVTDVIMRLADLFCESGAELAEINPLFIGKDGGVIAGDGKIILDDHAPYTRENFSQLHVAYDDEAERLAAEAGMPYLRFGGNIALMCAGAGLTTAVYDLVHDAGGTIAAYLEFGGPNYRKAYQALEICLVHPPSVILIVAFGTIARVDVIAEEAVRAIADLHPPCPVVFCLRGTNEERAWQILAQSGQISYCDTEQAVAQAVVLAKEALA